MNATAEREASGLLESGAISFNLQEAREILKARSVRTVRYMCKTGKIRAYKVGKEWRINRCELLKFMGVDAA